MDDQRGGAMSEREEVLREFTRTVEHCEFASDDVLHEHGMADEIVRLRSQLAAAESIAQAREVLIAALRADKDEARSMLTTAERERDEARAAIGTLRELVGCRSRNVGDVDMPTHTREIMEAVRHRAERAERVVEAVRDYFNGEPTDDPLYAAWCAYSRDSSSVRAFDAAEGKA